MQRIVSWVGPLLIATLVVAQQDPPTKPATPASAAERLEALQAEQKKTMDEWQQQMKDAQAKAKEAQQSGKPVTAMAMRPDMSKVVEMAKAAASDFAGTADAPQFLTFIVQMSSKKTERIEALDTLTEKHLDSPALAELGQMLQYLPQVASPEKAKVYAERLVKSGNADVRGWAMLAANKETIEKADVAGEPYRSAKAELQKAAEAASDAALKGEITTAIDTREKFGIGNVAPDIEGQDLDDVPFKLSDYKGKVIFLDFWGDW